jgi:hypothetical protein
LIWLLPIYQQKIAKSDIIHIYKTKKLKEGNTAIGNKLMAAAVFVDNEEIFSSDISINRKPDPDHSVGERGQHGGI